MRNKKDVDLELMVHILNTDHSVAHFYFIKQTGIISVNISDNNLSYKTYQLSLLEDLQKLPRK